MKTKHWSTRLPESACVEAVQWARKQSSAAKAWKSCERGDWMLWLLVKEVGIGVENQQQRSLWLARADCAELVLPIFEKRNPNDRRVKDCITAIRDYANGKISADQLRKARYAADAAAAYAADAAAAYAAYAAAAAAADAAAADAAAYAAAADAAAAAYAAYARSDTLSKCADIVRKHFPKAPI